MKNDRRTFLGGIVASLFGAKTIASSHEAEEGLLSHEEMAELVVRNDHFVEPIGTIRTLMTANVEGELIPCPGVIDPNYVDGTCSRVKVRRGSLVILYVISNLKIIKWYLIDMKDPTLKVLHFGLKNDKRDIYVKLGNSWKKL